MDSVDLYRSLAGEVDLETGWKEVGSLRLASSEERMEELARQAGWAKTFGLPLELVSADGGAAAVPADDDRRACSARPTSPPTATSTRASSRSPSPKAPAAAARRSAPARA